MRVIWRSLYIPVFVMLLHKSVWNFSRMKRGRCMFLATWTGSTCFHWNTKSSVVHPSDRFQIGFLLFCRFRDKKFSFGFKTSLKLIVLSYRTCTAISIQVLMWHLFLFNDILYFKPFVLKYNRFHALRLRDWIDSRLHSPNHLKTRCVYVIYRLSRKVYKTKNKSSPRINTKRLSK